MIFYIASGIEPRLSWLLLPLIVAALVAFATGLAMLLSALYVRFRDLAQIWGLLILVIFYTSPIIYPIENYPSALKFALSINPLALILEAARNVMVAGATDLDHEAAGGPIGIIGPALVTILLCVRGFQGLRPRGAANRGRAVSDARRSRVAAHLDLRRPANRQHLAPRAPHPPAAPHAVVRRRRDALQAHRAAAPQPGGPQSGAERRPDRRAVHRAAPAAPRPLHAQGRDRQGSHDPQRDPRRGPELHLQPALRGRLEAGAPRADPAALRGPGRGLRGRERRPGLPVVIKEPNGSYGAELVMSLLPGSRMIFSCATRGT